MSPRSTPFSAPSSILRKARRRAPQRDGGNGGGRGYDDYDSTTRGYEAVLLYVRKGLGRIEIIRPVIDFILATQLGLEKKWPLVPVSFGWGDELKHLGTGFEMGYLNDAAGRGRIAKDVCGLAGGDLDPGETLITQLYPQVGARSLYGGKTRVSVGDMLVFVGLGEGPTFSSGLRSRFRSKMRKRSVTVGVVAELDRAEWRIGSPRILDDPEIE